ncbi:hypothetical protein H0H87_007149 [Tephrocybe sp. NHM501043]|nr:hypothetical protein H0H87_007149 [Tephrocybe sp. NHM501043]
MLKIAVAASLLSALVSSVHGHGYVQEIVSGSTKYPGWNPYVDPYLSPTPERIVRQIPGNVVSAVWFKVAEAGYEDGKWAATDVLTADNSIYTFTIPANLKAGQYIVRHEM